MAASISQKSRNRQLTPLLTLQTFSAPPSPCSADVCVNRGILPHRNPADTTAAPPPPSPEELRQQEAVANQTVTGMGIMCVLLYLCKPAPIELGVVTQADRFTAPFAVDYAKKLI